jgi:hypothetical protein
MNVYGEMLPTELIVSGSLKSFRPRRRGYQNSNTASSPHDQGRSWTLGAWIDSATRRAPDVSLGPWLLPADTPTAGAAGSATRLGVTPVGLDAKRAWGTRLMRHSRHPSLRITALTIFGLIGLLILTSCSPTPSTSESSKAAPGGCGTNAPSSIPPNGVFIGVRATARPGVSNAELLKAIPHDAVALWCVRVGFVNGLLTPKTVDLQFLSQATAKDVQRSAGYLRGTTLFVSVVVVPNPKHY